MIYSFDVFDTCLLRACGHPSAVFRMTAKALHQVLAESIHSWNEDDFVSARVRAETLAREATKNEEITLEEIWRQLCKLLSLEYSSDLLRVELECERKVLHPNPHVVQIIQKIRQNKSRIVFLSDMYLPYEFILEELIRHGIYCEGDKLYLSSQIGLTKHSGNLYHHVIKEEALSPRQITHTGDNLVSDYQVPSRLGIHAYFYKKSDFISPEKRVILADQNAPNVLTPLASAMRQYRLSKPTSGVSELVGSLLGPVSVLLAQWVLQNAENFGLKSLYFFSRDCQSLAKVATILSKDQFNIECSYLFVSRQALLLPSASDCEPESMPWLFRSFERATIDSLLAKLELDSKEWVDRFKPLHKGAGSSYVVSNAEDKVHFWKILQEQEISAVIKEKIEARRNSALRYFCDQGLLSQKKVGIVDLGWHGTCQTALKKIIETSGSKSEIFGFFLGLVRDHLPKSETGTMIGLFQQTPADNPTNQFTDPVFNHITKIEHILGLATHPSVQQYSDGKPIFQIDAESNQETKAKIALIHQEIEKFTELYNNIRNDDRIRSDIIRSGIAALFDEFWSSPSKLSVQALSGIYTSADQNNKHKKPLVYPYTNRIIISKIIPNKLRRFLFIHECHVDWPAGSYAISSNWIKLLVKFMNISKSFIVEFKNRINRSKELNIPHNANAR